MATPGLALAAGDAQYRDAFGPLTPGFQQIPFANSDALRRVMAEDVAAVMLETIPATVGILVPPEDYFAAVRQICDEFGALLIIDEVQTGLGRCGANWGIDTYRVVPDIIVSGKGLSGGLYPMSATIYSDVLNPIFASKSLCPRFDLRWGGDRLSRGPRSAGYADRTGIFGKCKPAGRPV